ncbi:hypothetical protein GCM10009844_00480 [Nocardioides koreensis]|uniref:Helix-turn-helix domain-containing protein n=1 Tax=Nocardioides koreensis TaxID=433651 RepID=A0ABN2Z1J0_9ACTN
MKSARTRHAHAGARGPERMGLIAHRRRSRTVPDMTTTLDDGQLPLTELAATVEADTDPLSRLESICRLRTALGAIETATVCAARAEGRSWAAIGAGLGISKQAASKRFGTQQMDNQTPPPRSDHGQARSTRAGWEIAIPGRRALLHIRPRRDDAR